MFTESLQTESSRTEIPPWLDLAEYPFRPRRFATPDGDLSYVDEGSGAPVFLVHGTPSWSFEWRAVIKSLAATRRVIAPDHLGFGLSAKPEGAPYRPEDHARRLLALFDSLDLRGVTLVLHDFGASIGLPIAIERRDRVAAVVVLIGFAWPFGDDPSARRISRFVGSSVGRFIYLRLNGSPRFLLPASFGEHKLTRALRRQYVAPFSRSTERIAPWVLGKELTGSDDYYRTLWERRRELGDLPATIVWGARDPALGLTHRDRWLEAFPDAAVATIETAGHFPQEEAPDAVASAIARATSRERS